MREFLSSSHWTNPPYRQYGADGEIQIQSLEGSDFWRHTLYGFTRDSGHALLAPIREEGSLEVTFSGNFAHLYDQAGLIIRTDERNWIKAGIEITDGAPHLGAVVTKGCSDWSMAPVPGWEVGPVSIRASWSAGSVTLRARRAAGDPWQTFRVVPFDVESMLTTAGIFVCSPESGGLTVTFTRIHSGPADTGIHDQPS